jgi:hypothetical protein
MATTDSRTGFRLPWSSDQRPQTDGASGAKPAGGEATDATNGAWPDQAPTADAAPEGDKTMPDATAGAATTDEGDVSPSSGTEPAAQSRPNKFRADLTRAMMAAAETARDETMTRLQAEAKATAQQIQELSATEAATLRRQADDDVASIREWSKAEVTRVREETDQRIAERKVRLEQEVEAHAGQIERRIEKVQARVAAFEADMVSFFERLLAEEDPTRFAAMAEHLPQPATLEGEDALMPSSASEAQTSEAHTSEALTSEAHTSEAQTEAPARHAWPASDAPQPAASPMSAMAAIEEAARAAEGTDPVDIAASPLESEASADTSPATEAGAEDPRLSAFGGSADFAAAEAEAAAAVGTSDMTEEIPTIADDALAARLAGLVPGHSGDAAPTGSGEALTTQIVVTGLVSVASIASFKRHLGRVPGVQSVGVSSGPEGEFIFAAHHGPEVVLRDAIPGLPGFRARVTGEKDSTVEVAAHDPESGA